MIKSVKNSVSLLSYAFLVVILLAGCDSSSPAADDSPASTSDCVIPESQLVSGGVPPDGIPSLSNPRMVSASEIDYLQDESRVIGMIVDDQAVAIPHNILWWHEIANFDYGGEQVAVTYCPLTGSSIAFDRAAAGGVEFGVSGLLFRNNLTMFDRKQPNSLWPQMNREAGCGPAVGTELKQVEVFEMTWAGWMNLHPETLVIAEETGFSRNYNESGYPYGSYEVETNPQLLFDQQIDTTIPPKQRVLGIPDADGGLAFPFGELRDSPLPYVVAHESVGGRDVVVFWSSDAEGAAAFLPALGGDQLTFTVDNGQIVDEQTGSAWRVDGTAESGPLSGSRLDAVDDAYVAFWFAWKDFQPATSIWSRSP